VGAYSSSLGPYGTLDQGGDVWQWNETVLGSGLSCGTRGGSWLWGSNTLASSYREAGSGGNYYLGFRVASVGSVPEPGSITLLVAGAIVGLICWGRRGSWQRSIEGG
jgi:formylglycine-generating enzyme